MESLNNAFYFITDKIIQLQGFFIHTARSIAYIVLLIAVCSAAINYALTGTGLKENIVKTLKAVVFYAVVLFAYPSIVSWITSYTFSLAHESTYNQMSNTIRQTQSDIKQKAGEQEASGRSGTYGDMAVTSDTNIFNKMIQKRIVENGGGKGISYTTVAPAGVLRVIMLVAGECLRFADNAPPKGVIEIPDFGKVLKGLLCAFLIIFVGAFAVLEYLVAFIEFLFISSVGIILFPFSLWEGSKFIAEKFIGAMLGFFIKLLLCTICIFLLLWGYLTLARQFSARPFGGSIDQIVILIFSSLLFFYICKSAPAMAQSLLTGTPSLNAAGAIGSAMMAAGAVATAGVTGARIATGAGGAVAKGAGAAAETSQTYGGALAGTVMGAGAFAASMIGSGMGALSNSGSDLARSLAPHTPGGGNSAGRTGTQGEGGENKTLGEYFKEEFNEGKSNARRAFNRMGIVGAADPSSGSLVGITTPVSQPSGESGQSSPPVLAPPASAAPEASPSR